MDDVFKIISKAAYDVFSNTCAMISGAIVSVVGYFYPIYDVLAFLLLLFALDVVFGAWKAKKVRGEEISMKIVWTTTFPRMLIAFPLVCLTFMWDSIAGQHLFSTSKALGLFFAGVLLWSIAENGYHITKWIAFKVAAMKFKKAIDDNSGVDLEQESIEKDGQANS